MTTATTKSPKTMEFVLSVNQHGQITLPKAFRKLFNIASGETQVELKVSNGGTATIRRKKTVNEVLDELDGLREEVYAKNPSLKKRVSKIGASKTASQLREDFDNSPEGEAHYYKYTPAYYYEQHPELPRTAEIQAAIDKHNKLLEDLAAADPDHADRLEEYRAN